MFASKPKSLTLTLFFYTALTIVLATGSEAKGYAPAPIHRRDHTNLNRLIRKRAPQDGLGGLVNGAGNDPPKAGGTDAVTGSASQTTTSSSSSTSTSTSSTSTDTQTSSSTSSSASASVSCFKLNLLSQSKVSHFTVLFIVFERPLEHHWHPELNHEHRFYHN